MTTARKLGIVAGLSAALLIAVVFFGEASTKLDAIAAKEHAQEVEAAIRKNQIIVGMTPAEVVRAWGEPKGKQTAGGVGGTREYWAYEGTAISFRDGKLVSWADTKPR